MRSSTFGRHHPRPVQRKWTKQDSCRKHNEGGVPCGRARRSAGNIERHSDRPCAECRQAKAYRRVERHGRAGVPLYLLFAGKREPIVLPPILTPSIVLDGLAQLGAPATQTRADIESNRSKKE